MTTKVHLGDVATIERAGVDPSTVPPHTRYLGLEHIERGGRIIGHELVGNAELSSTKFRFTSDHLLFGKLRPNLGKIARPDFDGVSSTDILPIRPGPWLDRDYLAHYLRQPSMIEYAAMRATGANLPRLSPATLATFTIPLPPIEEQRRIAAILDEADAIRTKRRQLLVCLDEITESMFVSMFGGVAGADAVELGSIAEVRGGKRLPKGSEYSPLPTSHPYIRVTDLSSGAIETGGLRYLTDEVHAKIARYTVSTHDVLISIAGSIGLTAVVPDILDGANFTENAAKIVPKSESVYTGQWLAHALRSPALKAQIAGKVGQVTIGKLALYRIEQLKLSIPPISLQREFGVRVQAIDARRAVVKRAMGADEELFGALRSRAFRGELAVSD